MSANRELDEPTFSEVVKWQVVHEDPDISSKVYSAADPVSAAMKALRDNKAMEVVTVRQVDTRDDQIYTFGKSDLVIGKKTNIGHLRR
jgi:hypothetical protein